MLNLAFNLTGRQFQQCLMTTNNNIKIIKRVVTHNSIYRNQSYVKPKESIIREQVYTVGHNIISIDWYNRLEHIKKIRNADIG